MGTALATAHRSHAGRSPPTAHRSLSMSIFRSKLVLGVLLILSHFAEDTDVDGVLGLVAGRRWLVRAEGPLQAAHHNQKQEGKPRMDGSSANLYPGCQQVRGSGCALEQKAQTVLEERDRVENKCRNAQRPSRADESKIFAQNRASHRRPICCVEPNVVTKDRN